MDTGPIPQGRGEEKEISQVYYGHWSYSPGKRGGEGNKSSILWTEESISLLEWTNVSKQPPYASLKIAKLEPQAIMQFQYLYITFGISDIEVFLAQLQYYKDSFNDMFIAI